VAPSVMEVGPDVYRTWLFPFILTLVLAHFLDGLQYGGASAGNPLSSGPCLDPVPEHLIEGHAHRSAVYATRFITVSSAVSDGLFSPVPPTAPTHI
jgi:hypothetical protein